MATLCKYPKTLHLPWSPGLQNDDRVILSLESFKKMDDVVVMEKLDGENTTMYNHHIHARSLDSKNHDSRNMVKSLWGAIKWMIPSNMRICGENMFAMHSIYYDQLTSFFYAFAIFENLDDIDMCLSWDKTSDICDKLGIKPVPVLYRGPWNEKEIKACMTGVSKFGSIQEGYVVRNAKEFDIKDFQRNVVKFVRAHHIQTDEMWSNNWIPNKLNSSK